MGYDGFNSSKLDLSPLLRGKDPARFHVGDYYRVLQVHRRHAAQLLAHPDTAPPIDSTLLPRIGDARSMRIAIDELVAGGPKSPGPNGLRLEALSGSEKWSLSRALSTAVRQGIYRPGPEKRIRIPKEGKPGTFRKLTLQNAEDRIVAKSVQLYLRPIVDPSLSPFCFGTREGHGREAALATAIALAETSQSWVWIADDVADAFDQIPYSRFLQTARKLFPKNVVGLIDLIANTGHPRGLRQGSPASPLFADIFFSHNLDGPWHRKHPEAPLFRYLDDVLVIYGHRENAAAAYQQLSSLARSAGTPLKGNADSAIRDLASGESLSWLGYLLQFEGSQLGIRIAPRSWDRLASRFEKAHLQDDAPLRAIQIVRGWIEQTGPCFPFEHRPTVLRRLRELGTEFSFAELPSDRELESHWSAAYARWMKLRKTGQEKLADKLANLKPPTKAQSAPALPRLKPIPVKDASESLVPDELSTLIESALQDQISALALGPVAQITKKPRSRIPKPAARKKKGRVGKTKKGKNDAKR